MKNGNIYEFDGFRLVPGEQILLRNGKQVHLSIKSFGVLRMLVERHGHLVTKSEIIDSVWEGTFVEEGSLTKAVWSIRQALDDTSKERFIQTVPRRGYRFVFPVSVIDEGSGAFRLSDLSLPGELEREFVLANGEDKSGSEPNDPSIPETVPAIAAPSRFHSRTLWAAAILLAGLLVTGGYLYRSATSPLPQPRSVAVMPFANLTGQENDSYIVDGITEHLINSLSRIPSLRVAAPASSFAVRARSLAPAEASRELRVGHLLSGSVQRDGEFLRVSMRLTEGATGRVVWAGDAFGPEANIFALQNDIARISAEAITGRPASDEEVAKYGTADREAYNHYLKGRYFWHKQTGPDLVKAIFEFERAVARDATFALAYSGLSDSYLNVPFLTDGPPNESMPKAAEFAEKALAIDPDLPEALFSDAAVKYWYRRDIAAAERSIRRAIELRPNHSLARNLLGNLLTAQGLIEEGLTEGKLAVELDPLAHYQVCDLALQYYYGGRYSDAAALTTASLHSSESCPFERLLLGQSLSELSRSEDASMQLTKLDEEAANWVPGIAERARVFALRGEREKALKLLADLETRGNDQYVDPYAFAVIHAGFRDADKSIGWLDRAVEENSWNLVFLARDPRFKEIRTDPRFTDVLRKAGLSS